MKIAIGSDHAGFEMKQIIIEFLKENNIEVVDVGTFNSTEKVDYPDFAKAVCEKIIKSETERGILLCGSGIGVSVAANKIKGIRAGLCHDTYSARQSVEHDNVNVLCLGARVIGPELAKEIVKNFINASFSNEERHLRRIKKVLKLEEEL